MKLSVFKEKIKGKIVIVESGTTDLAKFFNEVLEWIYKQGYEIKKAKKKKDEPK